MARNMAVKTSYVLKGLTNDQSWALLKRLSFGEDKIIWQSLVGQKIAEKCGGVPLAIRSMGSMLQTITEEDEDEHATYKVNSF
ncbi:putative disease resistance protein RGA3 isoform X1 [Senna tora]|uniref:Putative disease resistance protein RGA3 isoform X1 n=1 Tax=Senna tora TaxID=362788 RepID=A0A835CL86_9FABA|nr:putative disease resistance protein RGA3 isoform X1 [Senna tora]